MATRRRARARRNWTPQTDRKDFLRGGEMPVVFGTFDQTILIAFLATHGPATVTMLASSFGVHQASLVRRLQFARRDGLIESVSISHATWNCINRNHPAYTRLLALAKKLGRTFAMPALVRPRSNIPRIPKTTKTRAYNIVDVSAFESSRTGRRCYCSWGR